MNKTNNVVASRTDTSTLVRAKFGPGMLLQHEDLEQLNVYTSELSRLMFRSLFGCGVVCGLVVTPPVVDCGKLHVTIGAGLALNCSGDPVHVSKNQPFVLDENCGQELKGPLWIVLCGATKRCAPRTSMCTDDDDKTTSVCTRERDMFEIRIVRERPGCACGCAKPSIATYSALDGSAKQEGSTDPCLCADPKLDCHIDHYAGTCACNCGDGSDCGCDCILLARLDKVATEAKWTVDHRVRRFIRPVLMRDPQVAIEEQARQDAKQDAQYTRDLAKATENMRAADNVADQLAEQAGKAAEEAQAAAEIQAKKVYAAQSAETESAKAKEVASKAKTAADKAQVAADKAAGGEKAAAEKAAALAKEAAAKAATTEELAKDAATKAESAKAEAESAKAEAKRATDAANAAKAVANQAAEHKIAADLAVASITEKAERFRRERMQPTAR